MLQKTFKDNTAKISACTLFINIDDCYLTKNTGTTSKLLNKAMLKARYYIITPFTIL